MTPVNRRSTAGGIDTPSENSTTFFRPGSGLSASMIAKRELTCEYPCWSRSSASKFVSIRDSICASWAVAGDEPIPCAPPPPAAPVAASTVCCAASAC
jgi:hypothetical protein